MTRSHSNLCFGTFRAILANTFLEIEEMRFHLFSFSMAVRDVNTDVFNSFGIKYQQI